MVTVAPSWSSFRVKTLSRNQGSSIPIVLASLMARSAWVLRLLYIGKTLQNKATRKMWKPVSINISCVHARTNAYVRRWVTLFEPFPEGDSIQVRQGEKIKEFNSFKATGFPNPGFVHTDKGDTPQHPQHSGHCRDHNLWLIWVPFCRNVQGWRKIPQFCC